MRSNVLRRALLLSSTVFLPFACVTSSPDPLGQQAFDGGNGFDSHVDFDSALPDGALPDTTLPPPPPPPDGGDAADAAPSTANVTVIGLDGLPKAGVAVVFQDAAGAIVEAKTTDALGRAQRTVADGTMVTVAVGGIGVRELVTFLGIKNGDEIVAFDVGFPPSAGSVSIDVPANPPPGVLSFTAQVGDCPSGFSQTPIQVSLIPSCQAKGKAPAVVLGYNDSNQLAAFAFKKDNPLTTDGGTAQITGLSAWSPTIGALTLAFKNAPASTQSVLMSNAEIASAVLLHQESGAGSTGGAGNTSVRIFPGYSDAMQTQWTVDATAGSIVTDTLIAKSMAPQPSDSTVSMDLASLFPAFTASTVDGADLAHPKLAWTAAGPFTGADGGFARIKWIAGNDNVGWSFIFPPGTTGVQGPQLPPALSAWVPPSGTLLRTPVVVIVDEDDIASYEVLLTRYPAVTGFDLTSSTFLRAPLLAPNATLRASAVMENNR